MKLNKTTYQKIINFDVKWLAENTENSPEREHILIVLWDSINRLYPCEHDNSYITEAGKELCRECGEFVNERTKPI